MNTGELRCTELLAAAMLPLSQQAGDHPVGAGDFEQLDHGVACTLHAATGDRYRVSIEWLGDDEAAA